MNFREVSLAIAESVDAWRVIPRVVLVLYSTLVFNLYLWYKSIPTYIQESCDAGVLRVLIDQGLDLEVAKSIACSVVDIVGGPTAAQSTFVTTIIGLSTGIFGLYVATGRRWDKWSPGFKDHHHHSPFPRPGPGYDGHDRDRGWDDRGRRWNDRDRNHSPRPEPFGPRPPRGPWGDGQEDSDN